MSFHLRVRVFQAFRPQFPDYLFRKYRIMTSAMRSVVRTIASSRIVLSDCLSVPKTIGIGPINITPPPLIFPVFSFFERRRSTVATVMISIPAKASAVPRL